MSPGHRAGADRFWARSGSPGDASDEKGAFDPVELFKKDMGVWGTGSGPAFDRFEREDCVLRSFSD